MRKFYIRTYGCQMNELDSEVMAGVLTKRGYTQTQNEEEADCLIFNTCSIRDLAERKVLGKIGIIKRKIKKDAIIGIAGCMATAKKQKLLQKFSHVDFVLGANDVSKLDDVLDIVSKEKKQVLQVSNTFEEEPNYKIAKRQSHVAAFVSIIRGCNKFCSYCIVPYTRGREASRNPDSIIDECKALFDAGYKEVTLLGQNVNSYGKDRKTWNTRFHDLLYRIDRETELARVRFLTSHPVDITRELMEAIRDLPSVCEFVHFPLQSGSNPILKKMNRHYSYEEYIEKVDMLRSIVGDVALGTDMIVGFPGETLSDFEKSIHALKTIRYSLGFLFAFSPRQNTKAAALTNPIPESEKKRRLQTLLSLQNAISKEMALEKVGKTLEVLVERTQDDGSLKGHTRCYKSVVFKGDPSLVGTRQNVHIESLASQTLLGSIASPDLNANVNDPTQHR